MKQHLKKVDAGHLSAGASAAASFPLYLFVTELDGTKEDGFVEGFKMAVTDLGHAWCGEVVDKSLVALADAANMALRDFVLACRRALCDAAATRDFAYELSVAPLSRKKTKEKIQKGTATFSWKRQREGIKFLLGSVTLTECENVTPLLAEILDFSMRATAAAETVEKQVSEERDRFRTERQQAIQKAEKCIAEKQELETELFFKFTRVLNAKKAKIVELSEAPVSHGLARLVSESETDEGTDQSDVDEHVTTQSDNEAPSPQAGASGETSGGENKRLPFDDCDDLLFGKEPVVKRSRLDRKKAGKKEAPIASQLTSTAADDNSTFPTSAACQPTQTLNASDLIDNI